MLAVLWLIGTGMAADMFLFWSSGSAPSWRVMLALEEKGLGGYQNKLISFDKQEHKGEDLRKWNPRGQVAMMICDFSIFFSMADKVSEIMPNLREINCSTKFKV